MKNKQFFLFLTFTILFSLISCKNNGVETEEGGLGIIVPGKSIEGINLGDSKEEVEQKLGKPSAKGWSDGLYRSWRTYTYIKGPHAGLYIDFIDYGKSYGPVDAISVGVVPNEDSLTYRGKTKEGIGIGSPLSIVHQTYGEPKYTLTKPEQSWIDDFYCFYGKKLEIHYEDSVVTTMSIGYFIPIEQDTLSACK